MYKLLLTALISLSALLAFSQQPGERARMENERKALQKELKDMQDEYARIKGKKKVSLGQLNALQRKMDVQERYIGNVNKELKILSDEVYLSTLEINHLQVQLDSFKQQYARSVIYAYKNRSNYNVLNFIFSASSFNDALKRVSYLRRYREFRQQQVANIIETQKAIADRKKSLLEKKQQKNSVLQNQTQQLLVLEDQRKEKDVVVSKLKSEESKLSKQITAKKKRDNLLKNQIAAIVRREIDKARKEEADRIAAEKKKTGTVIPSTTTTTNPSTKPVTKPKEFKPLNSSAKDVALNASFEKNRGGLPWPVDNGVITIPFGASKIGQLSFDNPGVSIGTPSAGATVKAVFDGEVSAVSNTGDGMMVMIRHGKYFSVYSNLSSATVSKGETVHTGQSIGRTAQADDGDGGQLDFMIMQEYKNVNPTPWLRR